MQIKDNKFFRSLFVLIIILGLFFLAQVFLLKTKPKTDGGKLFVVAKVPIASGVDQNNLNSIKKLYFSNSENPVDVVAITKVEGSDYIIRFVSNGEISGTRFIFAGQHVSLNQRIKVHGLLETEGLIVDFGKAD